jgi:hypothetical protein
MGIARFIRSDTDPASAELAIVVADDWQRRGAGFQLLRALLRRAREENVTTISAEVLTDNSALLGLLRHFGHVDTEVSGTTTTATLRLPRTPTSSGESATGTARPGASELTAEVARRPRNATRARSRHANGGDVSS